MKRHLTLLLGLLIAGCVTVDTVGSRPWYNQRMDEIEYAYETQEIGEEAYLGMKNETDQIRVDYMERLRYRYPGSYGIYYGYPHYHGHYYHHSGHHYRHHYGHH